MSRSALRTALALVGALALVLPTAAAAKPPIGKNRVAKHGTLRQLSGKAGCLADRSKGPRRCAPARALQGPGPFMGSNQIAVSPDGRNVYVAASKSDAIAIFARDRKTGKLSQPEGSGGCISSRGAGGCAKAIGLGGANSVAISPNGRNVYATARASNAVTAFSRDPKTGALKQLPGAAGCLAGIPIPGCAAGTALVAPDVVAVSPDGLNVYAGSFFGNAVAAFSRAEKTGALAQLPGSGACVAEAIAGCSPGLALGAPEGLAVSPDGTNVYVASALSNAVVTLDRDVAAGGALSQPAGGCIVEAPLAGCATGVQLSGANAIAIAPAGRDLYLTSLFSESVTSFSRAASGVLTQKPATHACLVYLRAVGCSFGRSMTAPEGVAISPDGSSLYVAAFTNGAIDVLDRERETGFVAQKPGKAGCLAGPKVPGCSRGRALAGVSSVTVSPDGRNVYATSFGANAVDVFRRFVK